MPDSAMLAEGKPQANRTENYELRLSALQQARVSATLLSKGDIQTEGQRDKQTDIQTDGQRDKQKTVSPKCACFCSSNSRFWQKRQRDRERQREEREPGKRDGYQLHVAGATVLADRLVTSMRFVQVNFDVFCC